MKQIYTPKHEYKVFVVCMTFNHSKYIKDALNGFAIQKTNFPFVCFVMDDCSTDGEQEVIKSWMECECDMRNAEHIELELSYVILVPHKSNANCTFAFYLLKQNLYKDRSKKLSLLSPWGDHAEYRAICEGDDYWIDPLKLQKQIDYLDSHPSCGLIRTDVQRYLQSSGIMEPPYFSDIFTFQIKDTFEDYLLNSWFVAPCSWVMRTSLWKTKPQLDPRKYHAGDTAIILHYASKSEIHYLQDVTAVYRVLDASASHFKEPYMYFAFAKKALATRVYYAKQLNFAFRMKFWWHASMKIRPSFRTCIKAVPDWFFCTICTFLKLLK